MGFTVHLSNVSQSYPQTAWNFPAAVPKKHLKLYDNTTGKVSLGDGRTFPANVFNGEIFVKATLKPGENAAGIYEGMPNTFPPNFQLSDWIGDNPLSVAPRFAIKSKDGTLNYESIPVVFWDGNGPEPVSYIRGEAGYPRFRFRVKTFIPAKSIHISGWFDVFSGQDYIPFALNAQYGDVQNGMWEDQFGSLSLITGEKPVIDFWKNKGLHMPMWRNDIQAWETELVSPRTWRKSRTIGIRGALLCMPEYANLPAESLKPGFQDRINTLKAREEAGICVIVDGHQDENLFGVPVIKLPQAQHDAEMVRLKSQMFSRNNTAGDEYNDRPEAQPKNSGRTGGQKDFGVTNLYAAIAGNRPWAIWEYLFNADAWKLRPYGHREADGNPVKAANHPNFRNYDMRPDTRFCNGDTLGWPNPIPYFEDWGGSDNQHRSDNLLIDLYRITKDPSLKEVLDDLVEVQKMELDLTTFYPNGPNGSSRGWGRPLISVCKLIHLGYDELIPTVNKWVDYLWRNAAFRRDGKSKLYSLDTVNVSFDGGSKYGWLYPNGNSVVAWICWEEAILVEGLWAAYKATNNWNAANMALVIARTIAKYGFFKAKEDGKWYSCYAVRSTGLTPLDPSLYTLNPASTDVYVYGMHDWMLPALRILFKNMESNDPDYARVSEILAFFGPAKTTEQSNWWSII